MAEGGEDLKIQLSSQNEQSDRKYNSDTCDFVKNVLDKCRVSIVEALDRSSTEKILDLFKVEGTFTHVKLRDLEDTLKNKTTSDCLREMCDGLRKHPTRYVTLKSALVRTGQENLLETIEAIETAYHDGLKGEKLHGCVCTDDSRCPLQEPLKCPDGLCPFESSKVKALQKHLLDVYKHDCDWVNPIPSQSEEPIAISNMYVRPNMKLVREKNQKVGQGEEKQRQVATEIQSMPLSYQRIFNTNEEQCRDIYVTGHAGMGKTTFCKQLVYRWCKAIQGISEEGDSAEDLRVLTEFRLLFYVNLREVGSLYHVEDMIRENVLHDAPTEITECNVSDILNTEKCLVVLDGLDEWSCPEGAKLCRGLNKEIPGRNTMNKKSVYLTTTRNWKFCVADLAWSKDYDKQVELYGIDKKTSKEFAQKIVGHLDSTGNSVSVDGFFEEVEKKKLDSLTNVPVLLIQLLTLWYFCKDLGKSQVQLYSSMLELLFEQAKKHLSEETSTENKPVQTDTTLPECFNKEDNCQTYTQLLLCLSKLAFMSLLNKDKEDSLIFTVSTLKKFEIGQSDIRLCLKCGIFTQEKGFCYPLRKFKKYSFLHKKLQEFLAAVYLVTSHDIEKNMRQVREYCDKLDTILEMGQMYMFVCGMNAEIGKQLLNHLMSVVSADKSVQNSRQSLNYNTEKEFNIQICVMDCLTEGASNGLTVDVDIQDYAIYGSTISDYISHVVKKNTSIKSVYIYTGNCSPEQVTEVLEHLQKVQTLERLWLWEYPHVLDISILASVITNVGSLQSLGLFSFPRVLPGALFAAVLGRLPSLRALQLGGTVGDAEFVEAIMSRMSKIGHSRIKQLLPATTHLTHLHLGLTCKEHGSKCRVVLDLSAHAHLQTLALRSMHVTNLHAVAHSVEKVKLDDVTVACSTLRQFIETLEQSSNKVEVDLHYVTLTENSGDEADLEAYIRGCDKFTVQKWDIFLSWLNKKCNANFHLPEKKCNAKFHKN